jgi:hypothetical protein
MAAGDHLAATQAPRPELALAQTRYLPGWWPTAETVGLYNPGGVKIVRHRYRGAKIPTPWEQPEYEQLAFDLEHLEAPIAR